MPRWYEVRAWIAAGAVTVGLVALLLLLLDSAMDAGGVLAARQAASCLHYMP